MEVRIIKTANFYKATAEKDGGNVLAAGMGECSNEAIAHMLLNYPTVFGVKEIISED